MEIQEILEKVKNGAISVEEAEGFLRREPFEEMGYAKLDMHRKVRSGFAEVIYCAGKADEHLLHIFEHLYKADGQVFGTRATQHQYEILREKYPQVEYDSISHIIKIEMWNWSERLDFFTRSFITYSAIGERQILP